MISEARNIDCMEYMKTIPSGSSRIAAYKKECRYKYKKNNLPKRIEYPYN